MKPVSKEIFEVYKKTLDRTPRIQSLRSDWFYTDALTPLPINPVRVLTIMTINDKINT
mgnify:FL=1